MKYLISLCFFILFNSLYMQSGVAATFIPISIEDQIRYSDVVIHGEFKSKVYKKLSSGQVVTVNSFSLLGSSGLTHSNLINQNDFKVITPGGELDGLVHQVSGTAKFQDSEEVVLFLKKNGKGFSLMNLSLGKYRVVEREGEKFLENAVFPDHKMMKPVKLSELQEVLVMSGKSAIKNLDQRHAFKKTKQVKSGSKKRGPASINKKNDQLNESSSEEGSGIYLLFILLALCGLLFRYATKKFT